MNSLNNKRANFGNSSAIMGAAGFTIVELLAVVAVFVILAVVAVPQFTAIIQNTRTTTASNELVAALNYVRSEAVRRGLPVSLCPDGANDNWEDGWVARVGRCDAPVEDLRFWEPLGGRFRINANEIGVTFGSLGERLTARIDLNMGFQDCEGELARQVAVGAGGRIGISRVDCNELED